jgi:hypothetical protein
MNLFTFIRNYADQINGQFTDYDHSKAVVVVPLRPHRFQTVLVLLQPSQSSGRELVLFSSKVCEFNGSINTKELLEENARFDYAKFIIEEGYLKMEASCTSASITEEQVREMLQEVATMADKYEHVLTGQDVH